MRTLAIRKPLSAPASRPAPTEVATPSATQESESWVSAGPCAPPTAWNSRPARMPERLATPITERSMPPVSIDSIIANDSSPSSGATKVIDSKL